MSENTALPLTATRTAINHTNYKHSENTTNVADIQLYKLDNQVFDTASLNILQEYALTEQQPTVFRDSSL